jgi:hypothetical protein
MLKGIRFVVLAARADSFTPGWDLPPNDPFIDNGTSRPLLEAKRKHMVRLEI